MPEYLIEDEKSGRKWIVESPNPPDAELVDKVINYGSLGSQAKGFGKSVAAGTSGLGESIYKLGELAMYANPLEWQARLTKKLTGLDVPIPSETLRSLSEEGRRQREEYAKEAEYTGAGPVVRGVGQTLPTVLTAVLPGALLRAPAAALAGAAGTAEAAAATEAALAAAQAARATKAGAAVAGTLGFGSSMSEKEQEYFLKIKSANPDIGDAEAQRLAMGKAALPALAQGAIEGGTTMLMPGGAEAATAGLRGVTAETAKKFLSKETLRKMGLGAGKEIVEEQISALGQTAVDIVSTKPELNPFTAPNAEEEAKRWKSLYDQVVTTAGVAGVLGAAGAGVSAKVEGDFAKAKESEQINFDALKNAAMEKQRLREANLVKLSDAALLKARVEATASGPFSAQFENEDGEVISKDFATVEALQKFEDRLKIKAVGFGKATPKSPVAPKKAVPYPFTGDVVEEIEARPTVPLAPVPAAPPEAAVAKPPSVEQGKPTETAPEETAPWVSPKLPNNLSGARPGYGYGPKNFSLSFESDTDRALFIVSQAKTSKHDAAYVEWLQEVTGEQDVAKLRAEGAKIREVIKPLAAAGTTGSKLSIPQQFTPAQPVAAAPATAPKAAPVEPPAAKPVPTQIAPAPAPTDAPLLGIHRPAKIDRGLEKLSDDLFDEEFRSAQKDLDKKEKGYGEREFSISELHAMALAQDRWTAADLERFRRNIRGIVPADLFRKIQRDIGWAENSPDSEAARRIEIILSELARQGEPVISLIQESKAITPDQREVLLGQLQQLKGFIDKGNAGAIDIESEEVSSTKPVPTQIKPAPTPTLATATTSPNSPSWVNEEMFRMAGIADALGIRDQILDLVRTKTAREITYLIPKLKAMSPDESIGIVRSVRNLAGINVLGEAESKPAAPTAPVAQPVAEAPTAPQATPIVAAPAPAVAPETPVTPRQRTELDALREEREKAAASPQTALSTKELSDASVEGANLYHSGAEDFNVWAAVMYKRYGAKIAPHLNQIYTNIRDPQFLKNARRDYVPQTQNENVIAAANEEIAAAAKRDPNLSRETLVKIEADAVRDRFSKMSPAARSIATSKVGGFFREWFTANKGLPPKMHAIMQRAGQQLAGYMRQIDSNRVELENAFKNAYGFKMDDAKGDAQIGYVNTVDEASRKAGLDAGLPPEVAKHVLKSRELIDKLSNEAASFLETSGADPERIAAIRANIGEYLHRSYRVFDDSEYLSSISREPSFDVVAREMVEDDKNLTIDNAKLKLERHIEKLVRPSVQPETGVAKSPLSVTASSPFKNRKDLSPAYRKLLGEYETPNVNIGRTAFNLAQFVTKQRALKAFLEEGVSLGLISHGENNVAGHVVAIPSESDNRVMDGFYTTKEFAGIIAAYRKTFTTTNSYLNSLITLSHISKLSNTVLSLRTVVDNLLGQPLWMIASGHLNPAYVREAVKTIWIYEFGTPGQKASPEYIDLINRGIIADGVGAEQMREALKFIYNNGLFGFLLKTKKDASNAGSVFSKIYNIPDSVVRYIGYKTELDRLSDANPGIPIEDIKDMAAERARATYPTGGNMPKAIQGFRSVPLLGTYAGFWWESQRVLANSVRLGLSDIQSGNPKMQAYGALRLGGVLAALSAGDILKHTIEFLLGTARSEEEEEQDRRNRPWWSRDQDVIYLSKDRKKEATWNPSNILPWNMYRTSLRAIARGASGEDAEPSILLGSINAAKHYFGPLMQQDMFLAAAGEAINNRDRFGRKIVEDDDDPAKPMKLLYHVVNGGLMPGTAKRVIENILPIARGDTSTKRSEDVTVGGEILKEAGFEVKLADKQRELADAVFKFSNENKRLEGAFRKVVFREKPITDAEMAIAYGEVEEKRKELYRRMSYALNAKRRAGFSEEEIFDAVKKGGSSLSRGELVGLLKGVYVPNRPSRDMMQELYRQRDRRVLPKAVFDKAMETSRF